MGLMEPDQFRDAMSHQAGGVAVITVGAAPDRTGLTATAVCSVSDDPPTVLVCVNKSASAHNPIFDMGAYEVNFLAADQVAVAEAFSGQTGLKGEARYQVGRWEVGTTGAPRLVGAAANLDCRVVDKIDGGTHTIFIARVEASIHAPGSVPLVYFRSQFSTLADRA